jgi:hypothetical protein
MTMRPPDPGACSTLSRISKSVTDRPTAHETQSLVQFKGQANAVANARMMALAPEMFDALELCEDALAELLRLDDGTCSTSGLFAAREALAKARPRTG